MYAFGRFFNEKLHILTALVIELQEHVSVNGQITPLCGRHFLIQKMYLSSTVYDKTKYINCS